MSEKKNYYKDVFLFAEDITHIIEAITLAQKTWRDEKDEREGGNNQWDAYCEKRINELQAVLNKINDTSYKELPTPNTLNK
jgi:hypothetical protein